MTEVTLLARAQKLAARGIPVFPVVPVKKEPRIKWKAGATTDPEQINDWWQRWPDSWVGVPMGLRTGLLVVDLDDKNGKRGSESFAALVGERELPECPMVSTYSGGVHLYFQHFAGARNSRDMLADGVDVRAEGGLVVAYSDEIPIDPPECPNWLKELILALSSTLSLMPAAEDPYDGQRRALTREDLSRAAGARDTPAKRLCGEIYDGVAWGAPGARSNALTTLRTYLLSTYPDLDPEGTAELFAESCAAVRAADAGVPRAEETTVAWIAQMLRGGIGYALALRAHEEKIKAEARRAFPGLVDVVERPEIQLSPEIHMVANEACAALAQAAHLYQRNGHLVRMLRVATVDAERARATAGTPQIREVPIATLRELLTSVARFTVYDKRSESRRPTHPPDTVVAAVHARGEWPGTPPLVGLIETPILRPDGSVLETPGYDAATGYLYAPSRQFPPVPTSPTLSDAREALRALGEPWADFPVSADAERLVGLAAMLTLLARPAIRGATPAFVFDASTRGSGKSLSARCATLLAQGREAALLSWPDDPAELEKTLASCALAGASVVCFDNVTTELGGAPLDKILTCTDRVQLRVLGQSSAPELVWRGVLLAGGNNLMLGGDTTRRVLVCRLEPMTEKPEERVGFRIGGRLDDWCREHHPRLAVAGLTLLRAYVLAGRPPQDLRPWGGFEAWSDLIAGALRWAGGPDIMACRPTVVGKDDNETGALRDIIAELPRFAPDGITLAALISLLYPAGGGNPIHARLREAVESLVPTQRPGLGPTPQRLGIALTKHRRRVVGGGYLDTLRTTTERKWVVRRHDAKP